MKRILLAAACIVGAASLYANNGQTKTGSFANQYWVVSFDGTTYHLTQTPPDEPCEGNGEPCMITSATNHDGDLKISATELNNPSQATIETRQD